MGVIFVKTRHVYQSYIDFWRLVECYAQFETRYIDEIDLTDDYAVYIFTPMNGEIVPHLRRDRRAKVVWWNLERPGIDPTTAKSLDELDGLIDAVWVSDRWAATLDPRFTYAFMASDARIQSKHARSGLQRFDVAPLAYLWGRREACINELRLRGITIAPQAWGRAEQDRILAETRIILSLHQYADAPMIAPLRFAIAAAYGIPIITETIKGSYPSAEIGPFVQESIEHIPELVERILRLEGHNGRLRERGLILHKRFCLDTDFRNEVEKRVFTWR